MATTEGAAEAKLTGPDLVSGVDANTLADGDKLLGHANGEQVLLARVKNDYFAIGATCTHYGGPLAEGELVGDTVRCPWHHACFSLRNGEALRRGSGDGRAGPRNQARCRIPYAACRRTGCALIRRAHSRHGR